MFKTYSPNPVSMNDVESAVIANSQFIAIGGAIVASTGANSEFVLPASSTTSKILGVVVGFSPISSAASTLTQEATSYTAGSANQTTGGQIRARFVPARLPVKWTADMSAATETTTGSSGYGYFSMGSTQLVLDETTFVNSNNYTALNPVGLQFASMGVATNYGPNYTTSQVCGYWNLYV